MNMNLEQAREILENPNEHDEAMVQCAAYWLTVDANATQEDRQLAAAVCPDEEPTR